MLIRCESPSSALVRIRAGEPLGGHGPQGTFSLTDDKAERQQGLPTNWALLVDC